MDDYYSKKLSAARLALVYDLAPPAARRYLEGEIEFVRSHLTPSTRLLELGCGYGRVLAELAPHAGVAWGLDTSMESLAMAHVHLRGLGCSLLAMDAARIGLPDDSFDLVCCIQNGISAFQVDQEQLVKEAVRVTRPGGVVLFSSYADCFWDHRLEWFRIQATHSLLGPIDEAATGDGVIVCADGFCATTVGADRFEELARAAGCRATITEVAQSSLFCSLVVEDR